MNQTIEELKSFLTSTQLVSVVLRDLQQFRHINYSKEDELIFLTIC